MVRVLARGLATAWLFLPTAGAADAPTPWPPAAFLPVTRERVAALPAEEQPRWREYLEASERRARALSRLSDHEETTPLPSGPPLGARHTRGLRDERPPAWYAGPEAATIADRIVERQTAAGGWTKGIDYTQPRLPGGAAEEVDVWSRGTLDNEATSAELRFLARVVAASGGERSLAWRRALERGLDYLLAAQYPNGGFPQIYPLAGGYHDAITFNDSSMLRALEILRAAAAAEGGFARLSASLRGEAARALERGVACILASQIVRADGRRGAWGQQHDALTLRPCAARNFEPIAASAQESAFIVEFLMDVPDPKPAVVRAIEDAIAWLRAVALHDVTWERQATSGSGLLPAPGAPLVWARLYDLATDRPVFGDRDRNVHGVVTALPRERRLGYAWYGAWPARALERYALWRSRLKR